MPVTAQTAQNLTIGAGDVYLDDAPIGATEGDNIFSVIRTTFAPTINGIPGKLKGADYIQAEEAQLEVSIPELSATALGIHVPGAIVTPGDAAPTAGAAGGAAGGGANTTLTSGTAVGDTVINVAAATNMATGDVLAIGVAGSREYRIIASIATLAITVTGPLTQAHFSTDPVVEAASTTLALDALVGATNLKVVSVTGLVIGGYIRFGYPGSEEDRLLTFVGTTGAGGTGISFVTPTVLAHRLGDYVAQLAGSPQSSITSPAGISRRIPLSAYHKWELRVPALGGGNYSFFVYNGISTDTAVYDGKDAGLMAPRMKVMSRWDGAAPTTSPWAIRLPH
jgi:hypothetical protein